MANYFLVWPPLVPPQGSGGHPQGLGGLLGQVPKALRDQRPLGPQRGSNSAWKLHSVPEKLGHSSITIEQTFHGQPYGPGGSYDPMGCACLCDNVIGTEGVGLVIYFRCKALKNWTPKLGPHPGGLPLWLVTPHPQAGGWGFSTPPTWPSLVSEGARF